MEQDVQVLVFRQNDTKKPIYWVNVLDKHMKITIPPDIREMLWVTDYDWIAGDLVGIYKDYEVSIETHLLIIT